jgi:hypothetical protein
MMTTRRKPAKRPKKPRLHRTQIADDRYVEAFKEFFEGLAEDQTQKGRSIPPGFSRCPQCGEFNGHTLAKHLNWPFSMIIPPPSPDETIGVSCLCKGIPCRRCGKNKVHRPISNSYEEDTNTIGHWPYFTVMVPCRDCRAKEKQSKG